MPEPITHAVILAAGLGSRLRTSERDYLKPLYPLCGRPLIAHVMDALAAGGIRSFLVVVGYEKDELILGLKSVLPTGCQLETIDNPDYRLSNGISALKAKGRVGSRFLLSMADHLFEPRLIRTLLQNSSDHECLYLAVDRKLDAIFDMDDATKVRCEGDKILDIDKGLTSFQAVDTGLFVCPTSLFGHLERAAAARGGDCTLSDGVRGLAQEDKARVVDVGRAFWQDVDTPEMYQHAERWLQEHGQHLAPAGAGGFGASE